MNDIPTNNSIQKSDQDEIFISWIIKILLIAAIILIIIFGLYIYKFGSFGLSESQDKWGQFGDYIGGTANPIFAFLTFITLVITIGLQNKQLRISSKELELSRRELELTREELARSATAQESSEKALQLQAEIASKSSRLNTISFLLAKYTKELDQHAGRHYPLGSIQSKEKSRLEIRCADLEMMLELVFSDLKN